MKIVSIYPGYDTFSVNDDSIVPYFAFELDHGVTDRVFVTWNIETTELMMADYVEIDGVGLIYAISAHNLIYQMTDEEFALFILTHS